MVEKAEVWRRRVMGRRTTNELLTQLDVSPVAVANRLEVMVGRDMLCSEGVLEK
jgi:hypothetical protein